jgi:predicted unusual protein kinase regulating ubiquinone biosynthesis (AarF/ABC1/UbiB family)
MAASNIGNGFPKIWQETMSVLQDECPSKPFDVVESEFGKPLKGIFSSFEERPIGPASIGQIHKATLPQDGQQVIYKDL